MRSPRSRLETACRVGAFAILGWLLGNSIVPDTTRHIDRAATPNLAMHLRDWTLAPAGDALHVSVDAVPARWAVDWLGALRRAGHAVTWSGSPVPLAVAAASVSDPAGGVRIDVSAPTGAAVVVSDGGGAIDSTRVAGFGATVLTPLAVDHVSARSGLQSAESPLPDSVVLRPVLVLGAAGWEAKYVAAALEERGWTVAARFAVAPAVDVTQGSAQPIDTSRFSAVVALDSTVSPYAGAIERFARMGGGVVLAGSAAAPDGVAALVAGTPAARTHAVLGPTDTLRLGATGFYPVSALRSDAISIEHRDGQLAVAARRVGAGRVIQVGYDDTWRWRMASGPSSEIDHRRWWSRVVGSVAYVRPSPRRVADAEASAPMAALVDRLGPARSVGAVSGWTVDPRILITIMSILLLTEWASRRLRGMR